MGSSLKRRLLKNGLASTLQKVVRMLEQLLLVPFFISAWGVAYYGEWLTLTIVPNVLAFSNFGFGVAASNSFVLNYASKNFQKAVNINKTASLMITFIIILGIIISIAVLMFLKYFNVFENSLIDGDEAILALILLILARLLNFYSDLFDSYYRAIRKASLGLNFKTIKAATNLGVGLIVLLLDYGIVAFSSSQLIVSILFNIFYGLKGRKEIDVFNLYKSEFDKIEMKDIMNKGLGYMMLPAWQTIYFQGTTFVVRIVLGPVAVAVFNTVRTLTRSINQLFTLVNTSIFPELQFEIGAGNLLKAKKIFNSAIVIVSIIAFFGVIFLTIFGLRIYGVWTHNKLEVPQMMWYLFLIGILFNALWWTSSVIFRAFNKPHIFGLYGIIFSLFSVLISYILTNLYGLIGAAIGALSLDILMVLFVLPLAAKLLKNSVKDVFYFGIKNLKEIYISQKIKKNVNF